MQTVLLTLNSWDRCPHNKAPLHGAQPEGRGRLRAVLNGDRLKVSKCSPGRKREANVCVGGGREGGWCSTRRLSTVYDCLLHKTVCADNADRALLLLGDWSDWLGAEVTLILKPWAFSPDLLGPPFPCPRSYIESEIYISNYQ